MAIRKALASIAPMMARIEVAERRKIADQQRNEERNECCQCDSVAIFQFQFPMTEAA